MGPLSTGSHTLHMKVNQRPNINMMKDYTTHSPTYGGYNENLKPRLGHHTGAGYLSNFRHANSKQLRDEDSPVLRDNHGMKELHLQPYSENSGQEPLSGNVHQVHVGSRFGRQKLITIDTEAEAYEKSENSHNVRLGRTRQAQTIEHLHIHNPNNHSRFHPDPNPVGLIDREEHTRSVILTPDGLSKNTVLHSHNREGQTRNVLLIPNGLRKNTVLHSHGNTLDNTATLGSLKPHIHVSRSRSGSDSNSQTIDREGHTRRVLQRHQPDGLKTSTAVHSHGNALSNTATLRKLKPHSHVARNNSSWYQRVRIIGSRRTKRRMESSHAPITSMHSHANARYHSCLECANKDREIKRLEVENYDLKKEIQRLHSLAISDAGENGHGAIRPKYAPRRTHQLETSH